MHFATSKISLESGRSLSVSGLKAYKTKPCVYVLGVPVLSVKISKCEHFYKYYFENLCPVIYRNSRHFLNFCDFRSVSSGKPKTISYNENLKQWREFLNITGLSDSKQYLLLIKNVHLYVLHLWNYYVHSESTQTVQLLIKITWSICIATLKMF